MQTKDEREKHKKSMRKRKKVNQRKNLSLYKHTQAVLRMDEKPHPEKKEKTKKRKKKDCIIVESGEEVGRKEGRNK